MFSREEFGGRGLEGNFSKDGRGGFFKGGVGVSRS